jgi:hypothetical protein
VGGVDESTPITTWKGGSFTLKKENYKGWKYLMIESTKNRNKT